MLEEAKKTVRFIKKITINGQGQLIVYFKDEITENIIEFMIRNFAICITDTNKTVVFKHQLVYITRPMKCGKMVLKINRVIPKRIGTDKKIEVSITSDDYAQFFYEAVPLGKRLPISNEPEEIKKKGGN